MESLQQILIEHIENDKQTHIQIAEDLEKIRTTLHKISNSIIEIENPMVTVVNGSASKRFLNEVVAEIWVKTNCLTSKIDGMIDRVEKDKEISFEQNGRSVRMTIREAIIDLYKRPSRIFSNVSVFSEKAFNVIRLIAYLLASTTSIAIIKKFFF